MVRLGQALLDGRMLPKEWLATMFSPQRSSDGKELDSGLGVRVAQQLAALAASAATK